MSIAFKTKKYYDEHTPKISNFDKSLELCPKIVLCGRVFFSIKLVKFIFKKWWSRHRESHYMIQNKPVNFKIRLEFFPI